MSTSVNPDDLKLTLTRVFDAPRPLVFECCSRKKHMDVWMCPHGFDVPSSGGEFREGGTWHFLMISPSGEHFPVGGVYEKIVPNELLVFTHAWVGDDGKPEHWTKVTLRFEDAGIGKTRLTLEQSMFKSKESRDSHAGGWTECLDKLAELLTNVQRAGQ